MASQICINLTSRTDKMAFESRFKQEINTLSQTNILLVMLKHC